MAGPEDKARETIDELLSKAGWAVYDRDKANITAHRGVLIRYFPLKSAHGTTDYPFYVDDEAAEFAKSTGSAFTIQDATPAARGAPTSANRIQTRRVRRLPRSPTWPKKKESVCGCR